jgi:hypothetical protein
MDRHFSSFKVLFKISFKQLGNCQSQVSGPFLPPEPLGIIQASLMAISNLI